MLKKTNLLGVGITNEHEEKILEYLLSSLRKSTKKYYIVTPNPEILVYASKNPEYKKILNEAEIALPDGIGVFIAAGLMAKPFKQRITGVDFMELACAKSSGRAIAIGFLGGRKGVAEATAGCLKKKYPWLKIVFAAEELSLSQKIPDVDLLFVAFGHPRQEEWIYKNLHRLPIKVAMGVGGAFDYISGQVQRAPFLVRAMGFEWLYRLINQPWRWKRQLALIKFVWLSFQEGISLLSKNQQ